MGCTVSQGRLQSRCLVESPIDKRAKRRRLVIKARGSYDSSARDEKTSNVVLPPITRPTNKNQSDSGSSLRQPASKFPLKEPASNEFSFRNSIGSSLNRSKEVNSPQSSSRKSIESEANRKLLNDTTIGCAPDSSTLKNAPMNRHSGRFASLKSPVQLITSEELVIPHQEMKQEQEIMSSEIEEGESAKSNFKRKENRTFTLNPQYAAKYFHSRSKSSMPEEEQLLPKDNLESLSHMRENLAVQAGLYNIARFQKHRKLSITSTELVSYLPKGNQPVKPDRPISLGSLSNLDRDQEISTTGVAKSCNTLETQTSLELGHKNLANLFPSMNAKNDNNAAGMSARAKRRIFMRNSSLSDSKSPAHPVRSNAPASMTDLSETRSQANSSNVFRQQTKKLSVTDLFKRNLLEFVKDEEDDISPIVSSDKRPVTTMVVQNMAVNQVKTHLRSQKLDSIKEIDSQSIRSYTTNEKIDLSCSKSDQKQIIKQNESVESSERKDDKKDFAVRSGAGKFYKNLFELVSEDTPDETKHQQQAAQVKIPLSKIERSGSTDMLGLWGMSPIPMNSRPTFPTENDHTPGKQNNSRNFNNYCQIPHSTISNNCSILNETANRSIYNLEDNISATNVSKFEFAYENISVEYDEAKGIARSPIITPSERILAGIYSPMRTDSKPLQQEQGIKREAVAQGRANLMKLCGSQKDLHNSHPLSRKGSTASISSIHGIGVMDFVPETQRTGEESPSFNQHLFDQFSLDNESSIQSKKYALIDHQRNRSLKNSLAYHDSECNLETAAGNSITEDSKIDASKISAAFGGNNQAKLTKNATNFYSAIRIQEADSCVEHSNVTKGEDQRSQQNITQSATDDQKISTPTTPNDVNGVSRRPYHKMSSERQEGSRSPNLKGAILKRNQSTVIETSKLDITRDDDGQKKINQYLLIRDLGRGGFGKVKLAQNTETSKFFAVKITNKAKLKRKLFMRSPNTSNPLEKEIAVMKKLDHPNIVKLWEVIDDPKEDKLYLVMSLVKKGAVMSKTYWKHEDKEMLNRSGMSVTSALDNSVYGDIPTGKKVLSEEKGLKYFRELVLGLDYLHNYAKVIHRDIKPENLLIDENDVLKISDFGVSSIMEDDSDELKNSAGTKLFLPPESFQGKVFKGKPADIWAAGATLFFFLTGKPPFMAATHSDLMQKVMHEDVVFPEGMNEKIKEVIKGCLKKDPKERMTTQEIMAHPWLTENGTYLVKNVYEDDKEFLPSEQEVKESLTKLTFRARVMLKAKMKMHLNRTRDNIEKQRNSFLDESVCKKGQGEDIIDKGRQSDILSKLNNESQSKDRNGNPAKKVEPNSRVITVQRQNLLQAVKET